MKISIGVGMIFIIIYIIYAILMPFFFRFLIDEKYYSGMSYINIIALGYVFTVFYKVIVGHYFYHNRTMLLNYIAIVKIFLNIFFNYYLISIFGAIGGAYATFITLFLEFVLTLVFLKIVYSTKLQHENSINKDN